jgi:2-octaprenyl-6-methoxyphenol hydroxylase
MLGIRPVSVVYDVAVAGGGIAGLATALRLAAAGADVLVIDARPPPAAGAVDGRTAALLDPAIMLLDDLGVWLQVAADAARLAALRIVNLSVRRGVDADVTFRASEAGLSSFGSNVPNDRLRQALFDACTNTSMIRLLHGRKITGMDVSEDAARLVVDDGSAVAAKLIVAADGQRSFVRRTVGIGATERAYGQTAIVCSFAHEWPHHDTSIELHRPGGPFTMVPLPGTRSSLVWVEFDDVAAALSRLDDAAFCAELERRAKPWLGAVDDVSTRQQFPLRAILADRLTAPRVALASEAAHALSPIGAQGLNLSLRDVDALGHLVDHAKRAGADVGSERLLADYRVARGADIRARFHAVDALNRAVASDLRPLRMARAWVLRLAGQTPMLRKQLMRTMMRPVTLPRPLARLAA